MSDLIDFIDVTEDQPRQQMKQQPKQPAGHGKTAKDRETAFRAMLGTKAERIGTGLASLDSAFGGGLPSGLTVIGAISSLGKTTFCVQVADYIAKSGRDVLIFSLEMGALELMAKSVSRESYFASADYIASDGLKLAPGQYACNMLDLIANGVMCFGGDAKKQEILETAMDKYFAYADRIRIVDDMERVTAEDIKKIAEAHAATHGGRFPVLIIDYLQILTPADTARDTRKSIDDDVKSLRRFGQRNNVPVILISSFSRDNYNEGVTMKAFKESGGIEYSADLLLGLQYDGMGELDASTAAGKRRGKCIMATASEVAQAGGAQMVECVILKSRFGSKGSVHLGFNPRFNFWNEASEQDLKNWRAWIEHREQAAGASSSAKQPTPAPGPAQGQQAKQQQAPPAKIVSKMAAGVWKCPQCGEINSVRVNFCGCGVSRKKECPECKTEVEMVIGGPKTECPHCGKKFFE